MRPSLRSILFCISVFLVLSTFSMLHAQSNSGSVTGVVADPSGAVIPGASVTIQNPVSGYSRTTTSDSTGH
ncbi:MAG TPA: carboxypeptidase-like regulatory domain-containing protein, partial [Terracidiphilus sp.]